MSALPAMNEQFHERRIGKSYRTASGNLIDPTARISHIETMTIGLANYLLDMNVKNRKVKRSKVETYVDQFERGRWVLTNQGIGVDFEGILVDGQHRLLSWLELAKAGVIARWDVVIVTGLCKDAQSKVDNGALRTVADSLKLMMDSDVNNNLVAVVRILRGGIRVGKKKDGSGTEGFVTCTDASKKTDAQDVAAFLIEHLEDTIKPVMKACGKQPAPIVAALCEYALRGYLPEAVDLAEQIRRGEGLTSSDPAYKIRERLLGNDAKDTKRRGLHSDTARCELYAKAVSACCAHARKQPLSKLYAATSWAGLPVRREFP